MKNKLIKAVIITVGIILILALIEATIRIVLEKVNDFSNERKIQKQEKIEFNSPRKQNERQVKKFMDNIIDAINDKDYKYTFDSLDEVYKKYKFNDDINKFKTYLNDYEKIEKGYEYIRVEQMGGLYQVLIGIKKGNDYSSIPFTVRIIDDNTCSFMFEEYETFLKKNITSDYSNIRYNISYYYETPNSIVYVIDSYNNTSENIELEFPENCEIQTTNGNTLEANMPDKLLVKPNEYERIELLFPKKTIDGSFIKFNVKENGELKEVFISLFEDTM